MSENIKTEKTNVMKNILIILSPMLIFLFFILYNMLDVGNNTYEELKDQDKIYGNYLALPFDGIVKEESDLMDLSFITIYKKSFGETTINVIKFNKNDVIVNIEEGDNNSIIITTDDKENIIMNKENTSPYKSIVLKSNKEEKNIITITLDKDTKLTEQ